MRVLWFSITPSCYSADGPLGTKGGGWVASLERIVRSMPDVELGVAFELNTPVRKDSADGVTYYPISVADGWYRMRSRFTIAHQAPALLEHCRRIVDDFRPDIIQVFGTEWPFGLIARYADVPVVAHLQGNMAAYRRYLYPAGTSASGLAKYSLLRLNLRKAAAAYLERRKADQRVAMEREVFAAVRHYMGRTAWDRALVDVQAPVGSTYSTCNEALRPEFYDSPVRWTLRPRTDGRPLRLITATTGALWKGADTLLCAAKALRSASQLDVEWHIAGRVDYAGYVESVAGARFADCGVKFVGMLDAADLRREMLEADIYVQPTHIDNSPNALCEAMVMGMPCVATMVGGVGSMLEDGVSGVLVPDECYALAGAIKSLATDGARMERLGHEAMAVALQRHNPDNIRRELITAYSRILAAEKK